MATFPSYQPTYSINKRSQPRVRQVRFGDGYEQRITWGLNQNPAEYSLSFNLEDNDANVIESFLEARAIDGDSFDWIPPDKASALKFVCQEWEREFIGPSRSTLSLTLRQVFEP